MSTNNWREVVGKKIGSTSWEQVVGDVSPVIASPNNLELLTRENFLILPKQPVTQSKRYIRRGIYHVYGYK